VYFRIRLRHIQKGRDRIAMIEIRKDLSPRELKYFGLGLGLLIAVVVPWLLSRTSFAPAGYSPAWGILGLLMAALGWLWPEALRRIYLVWSYATLPIAWVVSHAILALIFYGLFTSVALLMRLFRYDPLARRFEKQRASYWEPRPAPADRRRYFRQY